MHSAMPKHLDKPGFDEGVEADQLIVGVFDLPNDPVELTTDYFLFAFGIESDGEVAQVLLANRFKRASCPYRFQFFP